MVKCLKCGANIDSLDVYETAQRKGNMTIGSDGYPEFGIFTPLDWVDSTDYECPECNQTLFDNEEDARIFLVS